MIRRLLTVLVSGLLLVCCDKPGPDDVPGGSAVPETRGSRGRHSMCETRPGSLALLRKILQAASEIESPEAREKVIADVAWNALETDPDLACDAFMQLTPGSSEKIRLIQQYTLRLAEEDPHEALAWAAGLGSESERSAAHSQIALTMAEADPAGAANLLSETGITSREFDVTVVQVVQRWAAQSPPDAAAWVVLFQPGPVREAGLKTIADRWLRVDPRAAFSWLSTLPDASVRQEAALGLEEAILQQSEDIRDTWLQHADPGTRNELEQLRERATEEVGDNIPPVTMERPPGLNPRSATNPPCMIYPDFASDHPLWDS